MAVDTKPAASAPVPASGDGGVIARLASQKAKFKAAWKTLTEKVGGLETENTALKAENAELKTKADTSEVAKRLDAEISAHRALKHRLAFNGEALKRGADPKLLDDLWKLAEVKPETDEPDLAALGTLLDAQKTARAWAFGGPPPDPNAPAPPKPAVGSGQGGVNNALPGFSDEQLGDPRFVMMHFDRISAAAADRVAKGMI